MIPKIHAETTKTDQKRDGKLYFVDVSFTKILLAFNASELPYIHGMEDAAKTIKDTALKSEIQREIDARKLEINDLYIGAEQEETASFCFFFPKESIKATTSECTIDRRSASFKNWTGATSDTDVKFFVPVWDSYANQYTPQ